MLFLNILTCPYPLIVEAENIPEKHEMTGKEPTSQVIVDLLWQEVDHCSVLHAKTSPSRLNGKYKVLVLQILQNISQIFLQIRSM